MGGAGWCCGCVGGGWLGLSAPYLSEVGEFTWQHMRVGWAPRGGQVHILGGIGHMKEFSHYTTILITTTTHPGPTTPTPHPPTPPPRSVEIRPSHGPSLCGELTSGVGRLLVLFMATDGKCLCVVWWWEVMGVVTGGGEVGGVGRGWGSGQRSVRLGWVQECARILAAPIMLTRLVYLVAMNL